MYVTYTILQYEMYLLRVYKVVNMSVSVSKLSFYADVNPCHQENNTTKQNISLVREWDIKMLALQSKVEVHHIKIICFHQWARIA